MNCTKCGKEIEDSEDKVCEECKAKIVSEIEAAEKEVEEVNVVEEAAAEKEEVAEKKVEEKAEENTADEKKKSDRKAVGIASGIVAVCLITVIAIIVCIVSFATSLLILSASSLIEEETISPEILNTKLLIALGTPISCSILSIIIFIICCLHKLKAKSIGVFDKSIVSSI